MDGFSAFFAALTGHCPNCGEGKLYASFLTIAETCSHCHVRYERWSGSWTIPAVMGYGSGAAFAVSVGWILLMNDKLEGNERPLIFATLAFTLLFYPVCKNISMFMLWNNGFMTPDPPQLLPPLEEGPTGGAAAAGAGQPSVSDPESGREDVQGNEKPSP